MVRYSETLTMDQFVKLAQEFLQRDPSNAKEMEKGAAPYISEEGLLILLDNLIKNKKDYNTSNTFIVWDEKDSTNQDRPYIFKNLSRFLQGFGKLEKGQDMKLIVGMTFTGIGHTVSLYLRNEGDELKVFLYDVNRGLTLKDSSSHEILQSIKDYAEVNGLKYKIIVNSTTLQKDHYTCSVFSYLSTRYFMKHGHDFFSQISDDMMFDYDGKFAGQKDPRISFLKADKLPPQLLKWGQYRELCEFETYHKEKIAKIRAIYRRPAEDINIKKGVQFDDYDLFATTPDNPKARTVVSHKKQQSLGEYRLHQTADLYDSAGHLKKTDALVATLLKQQDLLATVINVLVEKGCINNSLKLNHNLIDRFISELKTQYADHHMPPKDGPSPVTRSPR